MGDAGVGLDEDRQAMARSGHDPRTTHRHLIRHPRHGRLQDGQTALMYAAELKADGVASQLIAAKADLNAKDNMVRHDARMIVARGVLSGVCRGRQRVCVFLVSACVFSVWRCARLGRFSYFAALGCQSFAGGGGC